MLGLGPELAVAGHNCPVVAKGLPIGLAHIQHRFDGEYHAVRQGGGHVIWLHMDHLRIIMKGQPDTLTAEVGGDAIAIIAGYLPTDDTYVAEKLPGLAMAIPAAKDFSVASFNCSAASIACQQWQCHC